MDLATHRRRLADCNKFVLFSTRMDPIIENTNLREGEGGMHLDISPSTYNILTFPVLLLLS